MALFPTQEIVVDILRLLTVAQGRLVLQLLREPNAMAGLIVLFRRYADYDDRIIYLWQTFVNISVYPRHTVEAFLSEVAEALTDAPELR